MWAVVMITALAGAAGGIANWILNSGVEASRPDAAGQADIHPTIQFGMIGYIVVGVVAAFTIPLFLSLAQSDLMAKVLRDPGSLEDRMVFAGFCIIAAFSSRAFMSSVSAALIKEVREVGEKADKAKATAAEAKIAVGEAEERVEEIADNVGSAATIGEAPATEAAIEAQTVAPFDVDLLSADEKNVLHAASRMSLRTLQGIVRDSGVSKDRISEIIDGLIAKGLLERTRSQSTGNLRYRLTGKGVATTNRLLHPD